MLRKLIREDDKVTLAALKIHWATCWGCLEKVHKWCLGIWKKGKKWKSNWEKRLRLSAFLSYFHSCAVWRLRETEKSFEQVWVISSNVGVNYFSAKSSLLFRVCFRVRELVCLTEVVLGFAEKIVIALSAARRKWVWGSCWTCKHPLLLILVPKVTRHTTE